MSASTQLLKKVRTALINEHLPKISHSEAAHITTNVMSYTPSVANEGHILSFLFSAGYLDSKPVLNALY